MTDHPGRSKATTQPVDLCGDLRSRLVQRGIPTEQIRFIHEAKTRAAQAELFAACRDGRVAVIVGSTEKMGTGTTIQHRLVALHHVDPPWRPADMNCARVRILRQGNINPEVHVLRYTTARSYDAVMWSGLDRKAGFIAQLMNAHVGVRSVEEADAP